MIVNYELLGSIQYGSTIKYDNQLKTSGSPVLFLQDVLYREKEFPEGVLPHLLGVTKEYCGPLHDLLCKYQRCIPWAATRNRYYQIRSCETYTQFHAGTGYGTSMKRAIPP